MKLDELRQNIRHANPAKIFKVVLVALSGLVVLAFLGVFLLSVFGGFDDSGRFQSAETLSVSDSASFQSSSGTGRDVARESGQPNDVGVSADAESFEVSEYSARVQTRQLEGACERIAELKPREDVIFQKARESDERCRYEFQVENAQAGEVLEVVRALEPRELVSNTYTIEEQIEDTTSEIEILEDKLATIEETLAQARDSYESVRELASQARDPQALSDVISSKVSTIERLTTERVNTANRLKQLRQDRAEALSRLEYTFFSVTISEKRYVDWQGIGDSWQQAVENLVSTVSAALQGVTVNLLGYLALAIPAVLYLLILLFAFKYGVRFVRYIWYK